MNHLGSTILLLAAAGVVAGCATDRATSVASAPVSQVNTSNEGLSADAAVTLLPLATPDGTGQAVHPDYAQMPGWAVSQYLVATPYANSQISVENPSIFSQNTDLTWSPTAGKAVDIAKPYRGRGYLSDPDVVGVPEFDELWVYYRAVTAKSNTIQLIRSGDGINFTAPRTVVETPTHQVVSPTVVRRDSTDWTMWSVNAGKAGCDAAGTSVEIRRSVNGLDWTDPKPVALTQPGYSVWHIDVQWIESRREYWAIYNVKTAGNCATPGLYLATSPDGVNWQTYPSPVLERGAIPEFADVVYRSTFSYDPERDKIRFWYSGARHDGEKWIWRTAYQRVSRTSVFEAITRKSVRPNATLISRPGLPPLDEGGQ